MKRRLLSILLLFCMTLTLFPVPAFAEGEEMEEASACVCTEAYTEEAVNYDCPVCGAEGAQACACGEETIAADAPESPDDVKEVHTVKDPSSADAAHSTYAADTPAAEAAVLNVTYTLKFYLNDGTDKYGQIFNVKNEITITQVPTRDGYDFLGWADTSDAVEAQYQPGTPIIITEGTEKTVYAVWKLRPLETVVVTPPTLPKEVYIGLTFTDDSLKAGGGVAAAGRGVLGKHAQTDAVQVQRGEAEIGEQAGSLGSKALTAGALLADEDAVLGTVKSMVHIPVVHRPHRRIGGLIHDDVLHDLAGGDLGFQPVTVHFGGEGLAKDKVIAHRGGVAPAHDVVGVGIGDGSQDNLFTGQDRKLFHTGSFRVF